MEMLYVSVRAEAAISLMTDLQNYGVKSCILLVALLPFKLLTYVAIAKRQTPQFSTDELKRQS